MHFANCAALAAVLFTTLIKSLRLSTAEIFLKFWEKMSLVFF